ncbi:hypothetical protein BDFB_009458 [Asbolus verrucosus]|uniref:Uncharacterized protein n=1 Tax=Asbolus verrucosus TaxID=1661398 RepID=A0A482VXL6_ASBVE|nr:hypothetical protein BDFB_009458 [Asbolus verrucosus]
MERIMATHGGRPLPGDRYGHGNAPVRRHRLAPRRLRGRGISVCVPQPKNLNITAFVKVRTEGRTASPMPMLSPLHDGETSMCH